MSELDWAAPPPQALRSGLSPAQSERHAAGQREAVRESLLEEAPITLVFNDQHAQVLLATPLQAEALALGFCLSEGLIAHAGELLAPPEAFPAGAGLSVRLQLPEARLAALQGRLRERAAVGGCGLCGLPDQASALALPPRREAAPAIEAQAIERALTALPALQRLNAASGAAHAAALADPAGHLLGGCEDASRHCALDKLIGLAAQQGWPMATGFVLVSSRASFELVQKAARVGVPALVAISAPTALALRAAQATGLGLWGYARAGRVTRYA